MNITNPPSNTTVNRDKVANFSCTATGGGILSIEWEVDGVTHSERCTSGPITACSIVTVVNETSVTSILKLNLMHMEVASLTIICIVNQTLPTDENAEVQLSTAVIRSKRSIPVHLLILQESTTTALLVVTNTPSTTVLFNIVSQGGTILYTMFGVVCTLLIMLIIISLSCISGIVFYAKKKNSLVLNRETESSKETDVPIYDLPHNSHNISHLPLPVQVSRMDNRSQNVETSTLTANVAYYGTGSSEIDVIKNVAYQPATLDHHNSNATDACHYLQLIDDDSTLVSEGHLTDETAHNNMFTVAGTYV